MSSIKLTADSGGGTFELKAPSSSATVTMQIQQDTVLLYQVMKGREDYSSCNWINQQNKYNVCRKYK